MKKRFYTLSLTPYPIDLSKDPGMIPYYLHRLGYESHFVSFIKPDATDAFQNQIEGVTLHYLGEQKLPRHPQLMMCCRKALAFILKFRKSIDILNLYYLKHSMIYGLFYKLVHPKGCLYVKVDMNVNAFEKESRQALHFIRRFVYKLYLHYIVDKVTVESSSGYALFQEQFNLPSSKLMYMPNGVDDIYLERVPPIPFERKRNILITVGRIGAPEKQHELLLEACRHIDWKDDWELHLIGPVEDSFKSYVTEFVSETHLENRIKFIGAIYEREKLFQYYNCAKIFCMTSRYESFGFVCAEALSYGNYLLTTPVSAATDFVPNDGIGKIVNTAKELAEEVNDLIANPEKLSTTYSSIINHSKSFRWSAICRSLDAFLRP